MVDFVIVICKILGPAAAIVIGIILLLIAMEKIRA